MLYWWKRRNGGMVECWLGFRSACFGKTQFKFKTLDKSTFYCFWCFDRNFKAFAIEISIIIFKNRVPRLELYWICSLITAWKYRILKKTGRFFNHSDPLMVFFSNFGLLYPNPATYMYKILSVRKGFVRD